MIINAYNVIMKPWQMELQVELQHLPWAFQSPDLILQNHCEAIGRCYFRQYSTGDHSKVIIIYSKKVGNCIIGRWW